MIGSLPRDLPLCASGKFFVWILLLITQKKIEQNNPTPALLPCLAYIVLVSSELHTKCIPAAPHCSANVVLVLGLGLGLGLVMLI